MALPALHRPTTVRDACTLLCDGNAIAVAGATDVYPAATAQAVWHHAQRRDLVDLTAIPALAGIEDRGDHWWLGATTTWRALADATQLPPLFDGLKAAAREIGGVQIQNRGTIGGNLVTASPAGDSLPCLLSLDAVVETASATAARALPLSAFLTGYRKTALVAGEIITGVRIPKSRGHGHFLKLGARRYLVISIVMVAGAFDLAADGSVRAARLAIGACSPVAQRLPRLEAALVGRRLSDAVPRLDDLADLTPIDDVRASGAYRQAAALQLLSDLFAAADLTRRAA